MRRVGGESLTGKCLSIPGSLQQRLVMTGLVPGIHVLSVVLWWA